MASSQKIFIDYEAYLNNSNKAKSKKMMMNNTVSVGGAGTLTIKVQQARFKTDIEFFSKQDPYTRITMGSHVKETTCKKNAGKNPVWNETLAFTRTIEDILHIQCYDQEGVGRDILLGECTIPLIDIFKMPAKSDWFHLTLRGKITGEIFLIFLWVPMNTQQMTSNLMNTGMTVNLIQTTPLMPGVTKQGGMFQAQPFGMQQSYNQPTMQMGMQSYQTQSQIPMSMNQYPQQNQSFGMQVQQPFGLQQGMQSNFPQQMPQIIQQQPMQQTGYVQQPLMGTQPGMMSQSMPQQTIPVGGLQQPSYGLQQQGGFNSQQPPSGMNMLQQAGFGMQQQQNRLSPRPQGGLSPMPQAGFDMQQQQTGFGTQQQVGFGIQQPSGPIIQQQAGLNTQQPISYAPTSTTTQQIGYPQQTTFTQQTGYIQQQQPQQMFPQGQIGFQQQGQMGYPQQQYF